MTELIRLEGISKNYGAFSALKDITLSVRAGAVTCVLGDNGAGKSTLIKILAGLHPASSGTMTVDGEPVDFTSPRDALDAGIATVYQDPRGGRTDERMAQLLPRSGTHRPFRSVA